MKLKIILLQILLLPAIVQAQSMFFGIKGGSNFSNINNDPNNHIKVSFLGHAGAFMGLKFHEHMGASFELLYNRRGTYHYEPTNDPFFPPGYKFNEVLVCINYIDLPLLFHYYFTPAFSAHVGLNINTPVIAMRRYPAPRPDENFLPDIFKNSVSMPIGINLEVAQLLNIGIRGDIGLSPIGNDMRKNNMLMLSLGFTLFRKDTSFKFGKSKEENTDK